MKYTEPKISKVFEGMEITEYRYEGGPLSPVLYEDLFFQRPTEPTRVYVDGRLVFDNISELLPKTYPAQSWQPISTYPLPSEPWNYDHPEILVFSPTKGIRQVRCVREGLDEEEYSFRYDNDGFTVEDATHWMPLPVPPCVKAKD